MIRFGHHQHSGAKAWEVDMVVLGRRVCARALWALDGHWDSRVLLREGGTADIRHIIGWMFVRADPDMDLLPMLRFTAGPLMIALSTELVGGVS